MGIKANKALKNRLETVNNCLDQLEKLGDQALAARLPFLATLIDERNAIAAKLIKNQGYVKNGYRHNTLLMRAMVASRTNIVVGSDEVHVSDITSFKRLQQWELRLLAKNAPKLVLVTKSAHPHIAALHRLVLVEKRYEWIPTYHLSGCQTRLFTTNSSTVVIRQSDLFKDTWITGIVRHKHISSSRYPELVVIYGIRNLVSRLVAISNAGKMDISATGGEGK